MFLKFREKRIAGISPGFHFLSPTQQIENIRADGPQEYGF